MRVQPGILLALLCGVLVTQGACTALVEFPDIVETEAQCQDDLDNDENGLTDCEEARCQELAACADCGDGIPTSGEDCDDGNDVETDACLSTCVAASCGDGFVHASFEACDEGANNSDSLPDACRTSCQPASCGDGVPDTGEACDDGNAEPTDACVPGCVVATCGDGFTQTGVEPCDDGNATQTDDCLVGCLAPTCGDTFIQAGVETCDDGNPDDTDACPGTCLTATCGDGFVRAGVEPCDDGNATQTDACLVGCIVATCGDGFTRLGVEPCDDGNATQTDACLVGCIAATCGDGFVHMGVEDCEDGNAVDTDACPSTCQAAACGDGFLRTGVEQCDDGNVMPGDGCESGCGLICGGPTSGAFRARLGPDGHCHLAFTQAQDVFASEGFCESLGGYIAVPNDPAEDALVRSVAVGASRLGMADFDGLPGRVFLLVTGDLAATYLNFSAGEPDGPDGPESPPNCVAYDGALATWQDVDCAQPFPFVCELHADACGDFVRQPGEACDDGNETSLDGCTPDCQDEDECDLGLDDCSPNATCEDNLGGFNCTCVEGFIGDGRVCVLPPFWQPRPPATVSGALTGCTTAASQAGRKIGFDQGGGVYTLMRCAGDQLFLARSTDAGATWLPPLALLPAALEAAVHGSVVGHVHVAAVDGAGNLVYLRSRDFGATWTAPLTLGTGFVPPVSLTSGNGPGVHVAARRNSDGVARVFSTPDPESQPFVGVDTIAAAFSDVLVDQSLQDGVWIAGDDPTYHLRFSSDGGETFPGPDLQPPGSHGFSDWAAGGGNLFVTGEQAQITIIPQSAPTTSTTRPGLVVANPETRAITADPGGRVTVVARSGGAIVLQHLPSGAPSIDAPVTVDASGDAPGVIWLPGALDAVVYTTAGGQVRVAIVGGEGGPPGPVAGLIHRWPFDFDASDVVGNADGTLVGSAFVSAGALFLDGVTGFMRSAPIPGPLGARTLVVWVRSANLTQRSGSVLTLENPVGADLFDGIVYAEQTPGQWVNGSDSGLRSLANNGGLIENEQAPTLTMLAISYDPSGSIAMFRNGLPYIAPYNPGPMITYPAGVATFLIGLRHSDREGEAATAGGTDAYWAGQIEEARVYDRPLSPPEIGQLFGEGPGPGP